MLDGIQSRGQVLADLPMAVCIGESMAVLVPATAVPLADVTTFHRTIGGAESNVARGLVALGVPAAWVSRVGDDGFGQHLLRSAAADGVDTRAVTVDPARPTGLYIKETVGGRTTPHYYRTGSAASALGPDLLADPVAGPLLANAALIHLTGITAALSASCLELLYALTRRRRPGQLVSFDLNWRPALWRDHSANVLRGLLRDLLNAADIAMLGADEAAEVLGTSDPAGLRALLPGPDTLVVKDDARQAVALDRAGATTQPALTVDVVEPMGAGDAFAAGYLTGVLRGYDQCRRLRLGHLLAASTLIVGGDHGAPPPESVLDKLLACSPEEWAATRVGAAGIGFAR
jgi:2-dehydro-3-deoxygluconokinase